MIWLVPAAAAMLGVAAAGVLVADAVLTPAMVAHATCMIVAWGALLPAGAVIARYRKVTADQDFPRVVDNPFWWNWHRGLQYAGFVLFVVGLAFVLSETGSRFATTHAWFGAAALALGTSQVLAGLLRGSKGGPTDERADPADPSTWRGDHYDMTKRRRAFELWHKAAGWSSLAIAAGAILTGIQLVGAPAALLFLVGASQAATGLAILDGALRRRWVDTYEALWGVDPRHLGNRRRSKAGRLGPRDGSRPAANERETAT